MLKVALVGCGGIGSRHTEGYASTGRTELVGVADILPERARDYAERYGAAGAYVSVEELLAGSKPDLVSIATPPGSHAEVAVAALGAGASVLIEKPITPTLAELDQVAAAAERSAGAAYAVVQHRHGSGAIRARELLGSGALGDPLVAVCETLWFRPASYFDLDWRGNWAGEGGGPTLGHAIHQIDLVLHLLGPWSSVTATTSRVARPVEFEDVSSASVTFESGAVATIVTSLLSPRELSRIRVDTTVGTLEVNHVYGYRDADWNWSPAPGVQAAATLGRDPGVRDASGALTGDVGADRVVDPWTASAGEDRPSNHAAQISTLVDDLVAGRPHATTLESARGTAELITGIYASGLTGRAVRRTDLVPGHPFYAALNGGLSAEEVTARMSVPTS